MKELIFNAISFSTKKQCSLEAHSSASSLPLCGYAVYRGVSICRSNLLSKLSAPGSYCCSH